MRGSLQILFDCALLRHCEFPASYVGGGLNPPEPPLLLICHLSVHLVISVHIPKKLMKLQLPHICYVCCAFWELLEQGRYAVCKNLSYILVHQVLPLYSVRPFSLTHSCKLCLLIKT